MMAAKARLFGDAETLARILDAYSETLIPNMIEAEPWTG
jgi:hypothetical protein